MHSLFKILIVLASFALSADGFELPAGSTQCVVAVADHWDISSATINVYERTNGGWQAVTEPWNVRLGKSGLVWGRGIHPIPSGVTVKREGDLRSPAGVFLIGGAWGYDKSIRKHPALFYRQVTRRDLWVEDPASSKYNQHIVLDRDPATPWERKQQMKQDDYPHSLKLFIAHNAPPGAISNAGSSIFFHIWRGEGSRATAGCTTMREDKLRWLVSKIDPGKRPLYVLLPKAEYQRYRATWKLP